MYKISIGYKIGEVLYRFLFTEMFSGKFDLEA